MTELIRVLYLDASALVKLVADDVDELPGRDAVRDIIGRTPPTSIRRQTASRNPFPRLSLSTFAVALFATCTSTTYESFSNSPLGRIFGLMKCKSFRQSFEMSLIGSSTRTTSIFWTAFNS